ncbi:MAG TPA: ABC transporter permease, partial [Jatrophihabitantaceae bacterium]|nr:ABC transporter permease [Jatrophihabitantaceae bacterium]
MLKFVARRFVNYLVLVFVATSLAYLLASFALNPEARYLHGGAIDMASVHRTLRSYNMDPATPVWNRYWHWLSQILLHGNFGKVFTTQEPITTEMGRRIGVSLRLLFIGSILSVLIGVLIGVWSALRQYRPGDHAISVASFLLLSTPVFLLATVLKFGATKLDTQLGGTLIPTS